MALSKYSDILTDPFKMLRVFWPDRCVTDYQAEIIESVRSGVKTTIVPAGNMLGKDYISAFIVCWFFSSRTPCRIVTSSIDHSQLQGVLWGEIRQWIDTAKYPLGIKINDLNLRQVRADGTLCGISQVVGRVAQRGVKEGLLGRHVPRGPDGQSRALAVVDEASGFDDAHRDALETWCHQLLVIGNCEDTNNFFRKDTAEGDLQNPRPNKPPLRRVIRIVAEQSPNIQLALKEIAVGKEPSHREVVPGVMSYDEYLYRRANWDEKRQTIGLDAQFYEGSEVKLFPADWIEYSHQRADELVQQRVDRSAVAMGIDPAEGGDSTVWTIVDQYGILKQVSQKTSDTSTIHQKTIELGELYGIEPEQWLFDAGGGGKQHADLLRRLGYQVRSIAFGSAPLPAEKLTDPDTGDPYKTNPSKEEYKNRRAQMYGELRDYLNPKWYKVETHIISGERRRRVIGIDRDVFAIPRELQDLVQQMRPIPLQRDGEGRLYLMPKQAPHAGFKGMTISKLIGRSPDDLDSLVLAIHGMRHPKKSRVPVFV